MQLDIGLAINYILLVLAAALVVKLLLEKKWRLKDTCEVLRDVIERLATSGDPEDAKLANQVKLIGSFICAKYWNDEKKNVLKKVSSKLKKGVYDIGLALGVLLLMAIMVYLYFSAGRHLYSLEYQVLSTALGIAAVLISTSL